jgi:hypothetical protein
VQKIKKVTKKDRKIVSVQHPLPNFVTFLGLCREAVVIFRLHTFPAIPLPLPAASRRFLIGKRGSELLGYKQL